MNKEKNSPKGKRRPACAADVCQYQRRFHQSAISLCIVPSLPNPEQRRTNNQALYGGRVICVTKSRGVVGSANRWGWLPASDRKPQCWSRCISNDLKPICERRRLH
jgi:hypothetical protein